MDLTEESLDQLQSGLGIVEQAAREIEQAMPNIGEALKSIELILTGLIAQIDPAQRAQFDGDLVMVDSVARELHRYAGDL